MLRVAKLVGEWDRFLLPCWYQCSADQSSRLPLIPVGSQRMVLWWSQVLGTLTPSVAEESSCEPSACRLTTVQRFQWCLPDRAPYTWKSLLRPSITSFGHCRRPHLPLYEIAAPSLESLVEFLPNPLILCMHGGIQGRTARHLAESIFASDQRD